MKKLKSQKETTAEEDLFIDYPFISEKDEVKKAEERTRKAVADTASIAAELKIRSGKENK